MARHLFTKAETKRGQATLRAIQSTPWFKVREAAEHVAYVATLPCGLCNNPKEAHAKQFSERLGRDITVCPPEAD